MESRIYGYARVSSKDQNLDRQLDALKKYVPFERDIFQDKVSGKDTNRQQLQALLNVVRSDDTVYVHSLDRLGRNKNDIKVLLSTFKDKGVAVKVLDLPTTMIDYGDNRGIMELINTIILEVYAYQSEAERVTIKQRQAEGIAAARARGKHLGRKPVELPTSWKADLKSWKNGKCTAVSLMKKYGWSNTTFYRKVKQAFE